MKTFGFRDLRFETVPVYRYSSLGTPFVVEVPIGMPRIPPAALDCVFYLYPSEDAAKEGRDFGGSGFFVGVPSERFPNEVHLYAITNWHVACDGGDSVLRLMTLDGKPEIFDFGPEQWEFLAAYDIAALLMPPVSGATFVQTSQFIQPRHIGRDEGQIGVGDDVFMVGRFIDHDGGVVNRPAARFGQISVLPAPIRQPNGATADSFCIDVHSRTGYSGSPVFVYRTPYSELDTSPPPPGVLRLPAGPASIMRLLGIHFAQFPELWELRDKENRAESREPLLIEGKYVKGLSGMTCVLPAWMILQVLNVKKLRDQRAKRDDELAERFRRQGHPPEAESANAAPPASDANPTHREDFMRLVDAAARKPEPKD
jgi:hypothetical protein